MGHGGASTPHPMNEKLFASFCSQKEVLPLEFP
jgi:hypothetical protein